MFPKKSTYTSGAAEAAAGAGAGANTIRGWNNLHCVLLLLNRATWLPTGVVVVVLTGLARLFRVTAS